MSDDKIAVHDVHREIRDLAQRLMVAAGVRIDSVDIRWAQRIDGSAIVIDVQVCTSHSGYEPGGR